MSDTIDLTNATMQDLLFGERKHPRLILKSTVEIDTPVNGRVHWEVLLEDMNNLCNFKGIVEVNESKKEVLSTKMFKRTEE